MTATRILRHPAQADDRVRLGSERTAPPAAVAMPDNSVPRPDPAQQALDERARRIEQLESRLQGILQERDRLRAALAVLEEQIAATREAAQKDGYAEGFKSGQTQAQLEAAACIAEWRVTMDSGARQFESAIHTIQSELGDVVMASIAKLLGEHAMNAPSIRAAIEQALREAGIGVPARVLVAPAQYEQLVRFGAPHLAALRERRLEVAPDPRITAGGCMLETANGLIDGRFEVQLNRLREIVAGHFTSTSGAR